MTDYIWKPHGLPIRTQGIPGEPILAFKLFVLPGLNVASWMEDSSKVTDTGMSKREWLGLVIHALALMDLTGDKLLIAKMLENDDGGLLRARDNGAVNVEQTLATHTDKRYKTLDEAILGQIKEKSSKGLNYAANRHLIILCNMDGVFTEEKLATGVSKGKFNIVNILGFNSNNRNYLSFIFDKNKADWPIHEFRVSERELIEMASKI